MKDFQRLTAETTTILISLIVVQVTVACTAIAVLLSLTAQA